MSDLIQEMENYQKGSYSSVDTVINKTKKHMLNLTESEAKFLFCAVSSVNNSVQDNFKREYEKVKIELFEVLTNFINERVDEIDKFYENKTCTD